MAEVEGGEIIRNLQNQYFFRALNEEAQEAFAAGLEIINLKEGNWLFRQGDPGDSMYFLDSGQLTVVLETESGTELTIDKLGPGAVLGEMALLSGRPRSSGVLAAAGCTIYRLEAAVYETLAGQYPQIGAALIEIATPRFRRTQIAMLLNEFFQELTVEALHDLQNKMTWQHIAGGQQLYEQGEAGDSMAIVVNGRLRIVVRYANGDIQLTKEIGRGQTIGEFSLLTGKARSADVYAIRDSDLLILPQDAFEQISMDHPQIGLQIARNIAYRAQQGGQPASHTATPALSLAIVPLSNSIDLISFTQNLAKDFNGYGPALLLNAQEFDARFGKKGAANTPADDPINIPILGWLTEMEDVHDYILYQADLENEAWLLRCLRQADRIILLADPTDDPALKAVDEMIAARHPLSRTELILIHEGSAPLPCDTAAWLKPRHITTHHHIRTSIPADYRRLIRRMRGRPLGLVLSGGAARGFAHVGVYRALRETGVEIDLIGGTSMGALLGAAMAFEFDDAALVEMARQYSSREALLDYTYPAAAIFETKKISSLLEGVFSDKWIEDLFIPFFCVSSNLTAMKPFIHQQGLLWQAVRASIAIPGVFAPVNYQGDILVDGGVMNNMPVDIMRELCEDGPVIAIDVSPQKEQACAWDFNSSISGWQVLRSRLNPFEQTKQVPSLLGTIMHAMTVNSTYRLQQARVQADLLIQLDTSSYSIMDWEASGELINLGYEAAKPVIAAWLDAQDANRTEDANFS